MSPLTLESGHSQPSESFLQNYHEKLKTHFLNSRINTSHSYTTNGRVCLNHPLPKIFLTISEAVGWEFFGGKFSNLSFGKFERIDHTENDERHRICEAGNATSEQQEEANSAQHRGGSTDHAARCEPRPRVDPGRQAAARNCVQQHHHKTWKQHPGTGSGDRPLRALINEHCPLRTD